MSVSRLALRLLLSLVLVLNGIGTGAAAARMPFQHAPPSAAVIAHNAGLAQSMETSGCPGHGRSTSAAKPALTVGEIGAGKTSLPDCCKTRCAGACLQASAAVIAAALLTAVPVKRVAGVPVLRPAHFSPVRSDLNRPPIG